MNNRFSRIKWIAEVLFSLILAGCIGGQSAPTQFYMIDPVIPTSAHPVPVSVSPAVRVSLDPVEIPEYLNRPQIVTHLDRAEYQIAEFNQWLEPLLEVKGQPLHRLAWHIGNRHSPCQIEENRLLIQKDHVMARMLAQLGADTREVIEPFTPEGGAYGHGRTHGHDHSAGHGPEDGHTHET